MSKLGEIFNYICKHQYGGAFADVEFESENPELYSLFMEAFSEENSEEDIIEYTINDKIGGAKLLLECLAEADDEQIEENIIELDHDLGYSSFSVQDIARITLECVEEV